MAGLRWLAVVLGLFLSAQNSLAVDQEWLSSIVEAIKKSYTLDDSFSLAVSIPENQDPEALQQVLQDDPADKVKGAVSQGQVYEGARMVAAAKPGALLHVLKNIQPLMKNSQGNVLIIYNEDFPNADDNDIANKLNDILDKWSSYAFVFSKPALSFEQLSGLGIENIFRCFSPASSFQCTSCSTEEDATSSCVENINLLKQGTDENSVTADDGGTDTSPNESSDVGKVIDSDMGTDKGGRRGKGGKMRKGERQGKSGKMRKGRRREKGGKMRKGRRRGKGGKIRKGRRREKGGKMRKGGRRGKGGKMRKGGRRGKGGKIRKGRRRGKGGKMRKGGRRGKGGKMRKGGRRGKGGKMRKGGRRGKGGKSKRRGRRGRRGKRGKRMRGGRRG